MDDETVTVSLGPALTLLQRRGTDLGHELFHLVDRGVVVVAEQRHSLAWRCETVARRVDVPQRHLVVPITMLEAAAREVTVAGGDVPGYVMAWGAAVWMRWPYGLPWRLAWLVSRMLPPGGLDLELDTERTRKMMLGLNLRRYAYEAVMADLTNEGYLANGVRVTIPDHARAEV